MFIQVDLTSSVAIYEQVVQQIKFSIAAGSILANELIPSVRELSKQLALNPNTVARAYRMLQDDGTVYARRGTGLAVAPDSPDRCKIERRNWFESQFRKLVSEALRCQMHSDEIREIILNSGEWRVESGEYSTSNSSLSTTPHSPLPTPH